MKLEVRSHEVRRSNELPGLPYELYFFLSNIILCGLNADIANVG